MENQGMSDTTDFANRAAPEGAPEPEEKEIKRRAAGFWWWSTALVAVAALVGGAMYLWVMGLMANQPKPQPQTHTAAREKIESAYFFRIDGKDGQGRAASFDFIILTGDYTWVKGSTNEVASRDTVIPEAEAAERVLTPKIRNFLASASDLIAVGLASQEGEREREEARALARSSTISGWLVKVSAPSIQIWTLTLGQYNKGCKAQEDADTSFERPIILAGVRAKAEGTNLQEALADAIGGHTNLPSRECYSRFDMSRVIAGPTAAQR